MAKIRPFRGLRYDASRIGDFGRVMAPPYDVVDAKGREALASRSDRNCIHFILPEGDGDERYATGAARFREIARQAMVRDGEPSVYVYHQRFESEGETYVRKGLIALVELTRFGQGPVLAHERTLAGPKIDRLNLMRACEAHLELVFGMFSDPARQWEQTLAGQLDAPVLDARFDDVDHQLWKVSDPKAIAGLTELLGDKKIYIADGHHRYETMCTFRDELQARGHERAAFGMIYLSNLDDPGLVVLPTHRLVHGLPPIDRDALHETLGAWFDVRPTMLPLDPAEVRSILAEAGASGPSFGLVEPKAPNSPMARTLLVVTLRKDFDPVEAGLGHLPPALQRLDVVLLHELVLERALGISKAAQEAKTNLRYDKSTESAWQLARGGSDDVQLVCFMNPTPVSDVRAVCDSGEVMPQKSTFFYPKIPNGLVFYDLAEEP